MSKFTARAVVPVAVALVVAAAACSSGGGDRAQSTPRSTTTTTPSTTTTAPVQQRSVTSLVLDPNHAYGDIYADGILPVGDGKLVLDAPRQGYIYLCNQGGGGGGASSRGPWFVNNDTEYDLKLKTHVEGQVKWNGTYTETIDGTTRVIVTNDVPHDQTTGVFPVSPSDPAYQYDRNPNHIAEQQLTYRITADPQLLGTPSCMRGESGVMTTGVALFNGFDAGNRDAGAWEVQDGCDGHPERTSKYHYHTLSTCIDDIDVTHIIGWALDGFPITGPKVGAGNVLTTKDLDECHGITSTITLDDKQVKTYHYVMTQDFPYSVSCFRASPINAPGTPAGP
ncbi:MAG: YHYH protein [Acidimicrobiia bacterium]